MKKFSTILIIFSLISVLTPILIFAQQKIPNCCRVGKTIELEVPSEECKPADYQDGVCEYEEGKTLGSEDICNLTNDDPDYTTKKWGLICLLSTAYVITDWIFVFLMALVGVMIVLGAFTLVTAAGNPDKVNRGKNYILYAAIGMIVGFLAKAIPALIETVIGL